MTRSLLFVLALMTSCGARTEVRDAPAFDVIYTHDGMHIGRWHSATGHVDVMSTQREPFVITCTRDGRFIAVMDIVPPFDLLSSSGAVLRTQPGFPEGIRPDGARLIVSDVDLMDTKESCVGTLDADGTYINDECTSSSSHHFVRAGEYSPDGQTVLWAEGIIHEQWTLATARDTRGDWRPIESGHDVLYSASWSPSGDRVAFETHTFGAPHTLNTLAIVRLDTLEVEALVNETPKWIVSFGFTPDGRDIVYVDADVADGEVVSARAHIMDLGTHATTPLEVPIDPNWVGSICVTSDGI